MAYPVGGCEDDRCIGFIPAIPVPALLGGSTSRGFSWVAIGWPGTRNHPYDSDRQSHVARESHVMREGCSDATNTN